MEPPDSPGVFYARNMMKPSEIAAQSGYASADALGAPQTTIDKLCKKHGIGPMTIGRYRYYPKDKVQKLLQETSVEPGMVSASQWCMEHGIDRSRIREDILAGRYKGRSKMGRLPGVKAKAQYVILPEEAAAQYLKKPELAPVPRKQSEWLTIAEASEYSNLPKARIRELLESGDLASCQSKPGSEKLVELHSLDAYVDVTTKPALSLPAPDAPAPTQAPAFPSDLAQEIMRFLRESNERQRELHAKLGDALDRVEKIEERFAQRASQFFANVNTRDETRFSAIEQALVGVLTDFEKRVFDKAGPLDALLDLAAQIRRLSNNFERTRQQVAANAGMRE